LAVGLWPLAVGQEPRAKSQELKAKKSHYLFYDVLRDRKQIAAPILSKDKQ